MRNLTIKQKKIIEDYVKSGAYEKQLNCDAILEELESINDYETLWSDADRLASDIYMKI